VLEDGGVGAAGHVATVLGVPVREEHDQDLEPPRELSRADKRVDVSRPAVLFEQLLHRRIVELEACRLEPALLVETWVGPLKILCFLDDPSLTRYVVSAK
jgi:hypothetical protein